LIILTRIVFYPPFQNQVDLNDRYFRALWYLPAVPSAKVVFHVDAVLSVPPQIRPLHFSEVTDPANPGFTTTFLSCDAESVRDSLASANIVLLWDSDYREALNRDLIDAGATPRLYRVDPVAEQYEGSFFLKVSSDEGSANLVEQSRARYTELVKTFRNRKFYVLCTGPSLATVHDHDFSDGIVIGCNSLVNNTALLQRLNPRVIVATDPIFHAGVSRYAEKFRLRLYETMRTYGSTYATVFRDLPVHLNWTPDDLANRIIGVPIDRDLTSPNMSLDHNFGVLGTANVLTLLMLPLVAQYAEEIVLAGCDGRPIEQNDYFWTHDPASQITDEMANIRKVHPGFFTKVSFDDYYAQHCQTLGEMISLLEKNGTKVTTMTRSFVPALESRFHD